MCVCVCVCVCVNQLQVRQPAAVQQWGHSVDINSLLLVHNWGYVSELWTPLVKWSQYFHLTPSPPNFLSLSHTHTHTHTHTKKQAFHLVSDWESLLCFILHQIDIWFHFSFFSSGASFLRPASEYAKYEIGFMAVWSWQVEVENPNSWQKEDAVHSIYNWDNIISIITSLASSVMEKLCHQDFLEHWLVFSGAGLITRVI